MLEDIRKSFALRKQHITDFVLIQNGLRLFESQQVEVILQDAGILENIHPAVNESLHVPVIQFQITAPQIRIQHGADRRMSFQERENLGRILLGNRALQLGSRDRKSTRL